MQKIRRKKSINIWLILQKRKKEKKKKSKEVQKQLSQCALLKSQITIDSKLFDKNDYERIIL